jgi:hypothetical protein
MYPNQEFAFWYQTSHLLLTNNSNMEVVNIMQQISAQIINIPMENCYLVVTTMSFKEYHCLLGHANKGADIDSTAHHNIVLTQTQRIPVLTVLKQK